jgi:MFS family permease
MYLTLPLAFILLRMYPRFASWLSPVGLVIMCLALALSSFSTTVVHLILTQGILYAVGGCLAYAPAIMYMDQWFVKRKGLAYGIMWSGTGLAGVILPLVIEALLTKYGIQTTLRTFSLVIFLLTVPLAFFIKPRVPASAATRFRPFTLRFLYQRRFSLYQFTNVLQALGYFLPGLYLPLYARITLGASPFMSALTVLLINVASVFGCVVMGTLSDRLDVTTCLLICGGGAALSTLLFWGLASSMPLLYVFSIVYGLFAGSFSSTWPGVMFDMEEKDRREREQRSGSTAQEIRAGTDVDGVMVFAFLGAGRGIGNVVSGPLADAMVKGLPWKGQAAAGYGSGYGTLIVFTGVTALCGGASFLFKRLGWL